MSSLAAGAGVVVAGRYELVDLVGTGRTSEVYRARDLEAEADVALKVLDPRLTWDPAARQRLRREVMVSRRCRHPGIVHVHDLVAWDDRAAVVQDLVTGPSLLAIIAECAPLPVARVVPIALCILEALDAAHEAGVVHRDVKPSNVLLDRAAGDLPRLIDFGIARVAMMTTVTHTGAVLGTPGYQAPEILLGDRPDLRADLYGVGLLLFEMLSGVAPFRRGKGDLTLYRQIAAEVPSLRTLVPGAPAALVSIVASLLERNPDARPAGAREAIEALRKLHDVAGGDAVRACIGCGFPSRSSLPFCARCGIPESIPLVRGERTVRLRGVDDAQKYETRLRALYGRALRPRRLRAHASGRLPSAVLAKGISDPSARALEEDGQRFGAAASIDPGWSSRLFEEAPRFVQVGVMIAALAVTVALAGIGSETWIQKPWWMSSVLFGSGVAAAAVLYFASRPIVDRHRVPLGVTHPDLALVPGLQGRLHRLRESPLAPVLASAIDAWWAALERIPPHRPELRPVLAKTAHGTVALAEGASKLQALASARGVAQVARSLEALRARRRAAGSSAALDQLEQSLEADLAAIEESDALLAAASGRLVLATGALRRLARALDVARGLYERSEEITGLTARIDLEVEEVHRVARALERSADA
ncbi:MAG: serine/threonine-protein kinase [Acidobacteriota bacterium]